MQTREENLDAIVKYIEYKGLQFVEAFSLISATVVEASYYTGIPRNIVLVHINRTLKQKYGEKYIKAQTIAHEIASGKNPNEERIMAKDFSKELEKSVKKPKKPKEPKERKKYEFHKDKSEYKPKVATTVLGVAFKEYTGLNTKENVNLYVACHYWYKRHKQFLWENKEKWLKACEKYGFEDKKLTTDKD